MLSTGLPEYLVFRFRSVFFCMQCFAILAGIALDYSVIGPFTFAHITGSSVGKVELYVLDGLVGLVLPILLCRIYTIDNPNTKTDNTYAINGRTPMLI